MNVNDTTDKALKFSTVFDINTWNAEGQLGHTDYIQKW